MKCKHKWLDQGPYNMPGIFFCCTKCGRYKHRYDWDDGTYELQYLKADHTPNGVVQYYSRHVYP